MHGARGRRPSWAVLERAAREHFGIATFRPGQREVIEHVFAGRDVLAIMPTGAGKSLTYQLPALYLPEHTVVVSPLISLMQDQQEKLAQADIDAVKLDSTLTRDEERQAREEVTEDAHKIIYVTPERLENAEYLALLQSAGVSLLVVDEGHCVSQWGHDFRPSYLNIRDAAAALGRPPVLAVTATATSEVAADIRRELRMPHAVTVNTGTGRDNLYFEVFRTVNSLAKRERLLAYLREVQGTGIIYVATVRACEELYTWLGEMGVAVGRYHGRLKTSEREQCQSDFMADRFKAMVATNAFGLGIDKPDIRFVVHYQFPDSVETYYQEAGRAGRDGKPARATLLYQLEDRRIQAFFLGGKYPRRPESLQVYETLRHWAAENAKPAGVRVLMAVAGLSERRCKVILAQLEGAGVVERTPRGARLIRTFDAPEALENFLEAYEKRHASDRKRLHDMMKYAQTTECRTRFILRYFEEDLPADCGHCDNCKLRAGGAFDVPAQEGAGTTAPAEEAPIFHTGKHVSHPRFGEGMVTGAHGKKITVDFAGEEKTVLEEFLRPAPPLARREARSGDNSRISEG